MVLNPITQLLPAAACVLAAALYGAAAASLADARVPWPRARTAAFLSGVSIVAAGFLLPGMLGAWTHDPRVHVSVHLLSGMLGPLLIAVSAPLTLALRTLRGPARRRLAGLLHRRLVRLVGHPVSALALSVGGLYVLYLTPLHAEALHNGWIGLAVQVHVVLAGTLFAWTIVGIDPVPRRPSIRIRGAVLLAGIALHTVLSRLLFADADRLASEAGGTASEWRQAAEIMWYEGDVLELALLVVFVVQTHRAANRSGSVPGLRVAEPEAPGVKACFCRGASRVSPRPMPPSDSLGADSA